MEKQEGRLARSANTQYSQPGRNAGISHNSQPGQSPICPGASVLGYTPNSWLREAAVSGLGTSTQGDSFTSQPNDTAGSSPGATALGDSLISWLGDVAGSS